MTKILQQAGFNEVGIGGEELSPVAGRPVGELEAFPATRLDFELP